MHPNDSNETEQNSTIDKSAILAVPVPGSDSGLLLDAEHVETRSSKTIVYLSEKSDGIDVIVGQAGSVVARSDRTQKLLTEHVLGHSDDDEDARTGGHAGGEDPAVMTDGGPKAMSHWSSLNKCGLFEDPGLDPEVGEDVYSREGGWIGTVVDNSSIREMKQKDSMFQYLSWDMVVIEPGAVRVRTLDMKRCAECESVMNDDLPEALVDCPVCATSASRTMMRVADDSDPEYEGLEACLMGIIDDMDVDGGAPREDVISSLLARESVDREELDEAVDTLRKKGEIYEPADGRWRTT